MQVSTGDSVLEIQNPKSKIEMAPLLPKEGWQRLPLTGWFSTRTFLNADLADQADFGGSETALIFLFVCFVCLVVRVCLSVLFRVFRVVRGYRFSR
jgi:hypothetical protein